MSSLKNLAPQLTAIEARALLDVLSMHVENCEADTPHMEPRQVAEFEACKLMRDDLAAYVALVGR